jgi:hypothetical protein
MVGTIEIIPPVIVWRKMTLPELPVGSEAVNVIESPQ